MCIWAQTFGTQRKRGTRSPSKVPQAWHDPLKRTNRFWRQCLKGADCHLLPVQQRQRTADLQSLLVCQSRLSYSPTSNTANCNRANCKRHPPTTHSPPTSKKLIGSDQERHLCDWGKVDPLPRQSCKLPARLTVGLNRADSQGEQPRSVKQRWTDRGCV